MLTFTAFKHLCEEKDLAHQKLLVVIEKLDDIKLQPCQVLDTLQRKGR
jgi:hypothetical protein